jgi:hypothetical protein
MILLLQYLKEALISIRGSISMLLHEASNTEEPCAGKPHAGIWEGTAG